MTSNEIFSSDNTLNLIPLESVLQDLYRIVDAGDSVFSKSDVEESAAAAAYHIYNHKFYRRSLCIRCINEYKVEMPHYKQVLAVLYKDCDTTSDSDLEVIQTTLTTSEDGIVQSVTDKDVYMLKAFGAKFNWQYAYPGHSVYAMTEMCNQNASLCEDCIITYSVEASRMLLSRRTGYVIIIYTSIIRDTDGKLLIPDVPMVNEAIRTYVMWEMKEMESFLHREGTDSKAERYFRRWEMQSASASAELIMPTLPDYIMVINETNHLLKNYSPEMFFDSHMPMEYIHLGDTYNKYPYW